MESTWGQERTLDKERPRYDSSTGMKGAWREVEAWHYVAGSVLLKRSQERLSVKAQTSCRGDQYFGNSIKWNAHWGHPQLCCVAVLSLWGELCALGGPLEPGYVSSRSLTLFTLLLFGFALIWRCLCPISFLLE